MTTKLHIDFETRSTSDLTVVGLDNYARHPTTDVWCMAYAFGDEPAELMPSSMFGDAPYGAYVCGHVESGGTVIAHNVAFELAIWNNIMVPRYGWPELKPEQCGCTMARAYMMGLPAALDKAAAAVGLDTRKDMAGHRLMLQMAKPRKVNPDGSCVWWDAPDKLERLYAYCKRDVEVERALDTRLVELPAREKRIWFLDYQINNRGIRVDVERAAAAMEMVIHEQDRLNQRLRAVTKNFVGFASETGRLAEWVRTRGVDLPGVSKAVVLDALGGELPGDVREALRIRREAGKSSTAKLKPLIAGASADGRIRNTMQYHGAGPGRWAGRRIQPHNMPRPSMPHELVAEAIELFPDVEAVDVCFGPPMQVVSDSLRAMLIAAPGKELIAGDFSNIEGRGVAWLAGEEWKLEAFRKQDAKTGPEIYLVSAGKIYRIDPATLTKQSPQRQTGKTLELACGYQGWIGAFRTMETTLHVDLGLSDDEVKTAILSWREAHPAVVKLWADYEEAALHAVSSESVFEAGPPGRKVKMRRRGSFLVCLLPSGRAIYYAYPQIRAVQTPWGEDKEAVTYMRVVDANSRKKEKVVPDPNAIGDWQRVSTYGGKWTENFTQGIARDVLADSMLRVDGEFPVILHVHDEIVSEVDEGTADQGRFNAMMAQTESWATGLPIAVEGWIGKRYRKG
jgi:DNA polymerase